MITGAIGFEFFYKRLGFDEFPVGLYPVFEIIYHIGVLPWGIFLWGALISFNGFGSFLEATIFALFLPLLIGFNSISFGYCVEWGWKVIKALIATVKR